MKNTVSRFQFPVSRLLIAAVFACLSLGVLCAQEAKNAEPAQSQPAAEQQHGAQQQLGINQQFDKPAEQSHEAAGQNAERAGGHEEDGQAKMVEELRHSPSVRWMADHLHLSIAGAFWLGIILNFAIIAALIFWGLKKNLPAAFRARTVNIQKGIEEAHKASEEANQRLAQIEARLNKLGEEVTAMQTAAEQETAAEEQRIMAAAEEDKRRIVEAAESEIASAAKLARHELKTFAADLAVSLAERRIHVDRETDQALVRNFTDQLADPAGKDGR